MKNFDLKRREQQEEFLNKCDSKESLGSESRYVITCKETGEMDSCQCAGTAQMLLDTKYAKKNVWIEKVV